jgi:hypothetical protein
LRFDFLDDAVLCVSPSGPYDGVALAREFSSLFGDEGGEG